MSKTFEQAYEAYCLDHLRKLDQLILKYAKIISGKEVTLQEAYDMSYSEQTVFSESHHTECIYIMDKHVLTIDVEMNIKEVYNEAQ